jgi:DNA-binding LacI/PurR family transcriptional regulator
MQIKRVTRKDVAIRAGVSTATVSYVLNHPDKVSKETYQKVMDTIRVLDYKPDLIARSMITNHTMQLGVVLEDISNPFSGGIVAGFESAANEKGFFINVCSSFDRIDAYFTNFIARRLDGVFVTALPYKFDIRQMYKLVQNGVKVINSGNVTIDQKIVSSVENDYIDAMDQAVNYLQGLGHENIAYISGLERKQTYDLRCEGYLEAVEKRHFSCGDSLLVEGKPPYLTGLREGYKGAKQLLKRGKNFHAVICTNDLMAIGAIKAFMDSGYRIPDDISVMGFDGVEIGEYVVPGLTTMALDQKAFGKKAFDMLYADITDGIVGYYKNKLRLVKRGSTSICNG